MSVSDVIGGYGVLVCGILIMSLSENEKWAYDWWFYFSFLLSSSFI